MDAIPTESETPKTFVLPRADSVDIESSSTVNRLAVAVLGPDALTTIASNVIVDPEHLLIIPMTRRSETVFRALETEPTLWSDLTIEIQARSFTPPREYEKEQLLRIVPNVLKHVLDQAGIPSEKLLTQLPIDNYRDMRRFISKCEALTPQIRKEFWKQLAAAGYPKRSNHWDITMASQPKRLIAYLEQKQIRSILIVDGELLVVNSRFGKPNYSRYVIIQRLLEKGYNVTVAGDFRSAHPTDFSIFVNHFACTITHHPYCPKPQAIIDSLNNLTKLTYPKFPQLVHYPISLTESLSSTNQSTIHQAKDADEMFTHVAQKLLPALGFTRKGDSTTINEPNVNTDLSSGSTTGETVLIVTPVIRESTRLIRQLKNLIQEPVELVGCSGLWKNKVEEAIAILDPAKEATENGVMTSSTLATVALIVKAVASKFESDPEAKALIRTILRAIEKESNLQSLEAFDSPHALESPLNRFHHSTNKVIAFLRRQLAEHPTYDTQANVLLNTLIDQLIEYLRLLNEAETTGNVATLMTFADLCFDFRLPNAKQESNGNQRRYPLLERVTKGNFSRLEAASYLAQRQDEWHSSSAAYSPLGARKVFVTHIQRTGFDRVDHVVVYSSLSNHMPMVHNASDPDYDYRVKYEYILLYRAVTSARESLHIVTEDTIPSALLPDTRATDPTVPANHHRTQHSYSTDSHPHDTLTQTAAQSLSVQAIAQTNLPR